ncbi:MAG: MazG family protein [Actinomycetota bacterium]|nr:MazG family protein [Actinomycetota bacterium]
MTRVVVVGLGPAGPDLFTVATTTAIDALPRRYMRTTRHPAAAAIPDAVSFDSIYESAATLDEVYGGIVDALVEAAGDGDVLYAVPGSPLVAERSVELLVADGRVDVEVLAAVSFLDLAWARLGLDPVTAGVRLVDGHRFAVDAAGERGPLLVLQCDTAAVLSEIKLAVEEGPDGDAVVLHHLGLDDESVRRVAWAGLDRELRPDHLTSLYVPQLAAPVAGEVARFAELVRTLRQRCPWDREQTHQTLTRHLLEETYEVLEAIEALGGAGPDGSATAFAHLEEELGDLLFQVVFHTTLAAEEGQFTLADVARGIHDKLVHRHPHVFGTVEAETPGQVVRNWEQIKKAEKGHGSLMDGISGDLPSLLYAHKVQRKAASVGLDWRQAEGSDEQDVGEVLFATVDWARRLGVDPEAALRATAGTFRRRFAAMEAAAADEGVELSALSPEELAERWTKALR